MIWFHSCWNALIGCQMLEYGKKDKGESPVVGRQLICDNDHSLSLWQCLKQCKVWSIGWSVSNKDKGNNLLYGRLHNNSIHVYFFTLQIFIRWRWRELQSAAADWCDVCRGASYWQTDNMRSVSTRWGFSSTITELNWAAAILNMMWLEMFKFFKNPPKLYNTMLNVLTQ